MKFQLIINIQGNQTVPYKGIPENTNSVSFVVYEVHNDITSMINCDEDWKE